jgi:catalase
MIAVKKLLCVALAAGFGAAVVPAQAQTSMPEAQVNALEGLFGKQAGSRRSQAKGLCATGYFVGNADGRSLSSAAVFKGDKVPVVARFSVGGGNPKANDKGKSVRGMALQFNLPNGETWLMGNISAPMYFVSKPEQFAPWVQVRTPDPATGKPDPEKLKAFNEANPETLLQAAYLAKQPVPASFGGVNYWSTNAFEVTNAQGTSQFVRWQFAPQAGVMGLSDEQVKAMPDNFLADDLAERTAKGPVSFDFKLQMAEKGDPITDPTQVWPETRKLVTAGQLHIEKLAPLSACDNITFNPLVLPAGIKPSADPVLLARPAPYGVSLGRRLSEPR